MIEHVDMCQVKSNAKQSVWPSAAKQFWVRKEDTAHGCGIVCGEGNDSIWNVMGLRNRDAIVNI